VQHDVVRLGQVGLEGGLLGPVVAVVVVRELHDHAAVEVEQTQDRAHLSGGVVLGRVAVGDQVAHVGRHRRVELHAGEADPALVAVVHVAAARRRDVVAQAAVERAGRILEAHAAGGVVREAATVHVGVDDARGVALDGGREGVGRRVGEDADPERGVAA
jgi:hypothetical protein